MLQDLVSVKVKESITHINPAAPDLAAVEALRRLAEVLVNLKTHQL